jgi:hypothetical protein
MPRARRSLAALAAHTGSVRRSAPGSTRALWRVTWPTAGSTDALVVRFDRPLDAALALRCITVVEGNGRTVSGRSDLDDGDIRSTFLADAAWPAEDVQLRVDAALEDLAGNSVRRVFDRDLLREADAPVAVDRVILTPTKSF